MRGLIQEMGGGPQDLQRLPTAGRRGSEGERGERTTGKRRGEGALPPLGGRGTPEEQAQDIIDRIINESPGEAHLAAKTRHHIDGRPSPPVGAGDGMAGTGAAAEEGEEGGGEWGGRVIRNPLQRREFCQEATECGEERPAA